MKIVIKTKNFRLTKTIKNFIEEKINSLEKFSKIFGKEYYNHFFGRGKPRAEAWVEVGKETLHHKKGPYFWAECQMRLPGRSLRSTARSNDLKLAIIEIKDELQRELKEYKEKIIDKTKDEKIFKRKS